MLFAGNGRCLLAIRPATVSRRSVAPTRLPQLHAVPSAFKLMYEDVTLVLNSSTKPLPKDAILDLLDSATQAEHLKQLIAVLKLSASRHDARPQKDWSFRMRVYKELAAKAVQLGAPNLIARLVEDPSELLMEKYFVKYLLQDLARQSVDFSTMELVLETFRAQAKDNPALRKGLRGAYYETMLAAHNAGLYNKFMSLYSQGVADGLEFSEGIKRAVTRLKNAPPASKGPSGPEPTATVTMEQLSAAELIAATEQTNAVAASAAR